MQSRYTAKISRFNNSSSPLNANNTFTGTGEFCAMGDSIEIACKSDQAGVLTIGFSSDNSTFDPEYTYTINANANFNIRKNIELLYFRISITNGSVDQTYMRLTAKIISNHPQESVHLSGATIVRFEPKFVDSTGRHKISKPVNILDMTHTPDLNSMYVTTKINGTPVQTHNINTATVTMNVYGNGDLVTRQTRRYAIYQPGKSLVCQVTGVINSNNNGSGVVSCIGYFDDRNGFFFKHIGDGGAGTMYIVKRSYVTGSVVETAIAQRNWNVDTLNGYGNSGLTIDFSKVQLYYIDLLWQGVGQVRMGVYYRGEIYICHQYYTNNEQDTVYISNANLPIRYHLESSSGAGELKMICGTVYFEGGYDPIGREFSYIVPKSKLFGLTTTTDTTLRPLLALRINPSDNFKRHTNVLIQSINIAVGTNDNLMFKIYNIKDVADATLEADNNFLRDTEIDLSTEFINVNSEHSVVQYFLPATTSNTVNESTITGQLNKLIKTGYITREVKSVIIDNDLLSAQSNMICTNINGLSDYFVIYCQQYTTSSINNIGVSVSWKEFY